MVGGLDLYASTKRVRLSFRLRGELMAKVEEGTWEKVGVAATVAGLVVAVVGVYFGYKALSSSSVAQPSPVSSAVAHGSPASSSAAPAPAPTILQPQGSDLGDLNFANYCMSMGYRLTLIADNADGWKCFSGTTVMGISVHDACSTQYKIQAANARYKNLNDPFSWYCYTGLLTTPQPQASDLGDVDFVSGCMSMGYRLELVADNADGWMCFSGTTVMGISVHDACSTQYKIQAANARYKNLNDPFSWYCYSP